MGSFIETCALLMREAGLAWQIAAAAALLAGLCEAARPKAAPGEEAPRRGGLDAVMGAINLVTPLLLFLHAFWAIATAESAGAAPQGIIVLVEAGARHAAIIALLAVMGVIVIGAAILGWIVAGAAPGLGRGLSAAAPFLAVVTLLLTVYATHENAAKVLELALRR